MSKHTEHTATPWKVERELTDNYVIKSVKGAEFIVCRLYNDDPNAQANAAHIVNCVNSHSALVEALDEMLWYAIDSMEAEGVDTDNHSSVRAARKALALAKGE